MTWKIDKKKEFFRLVTKFTEIPRGIVLRTRFASDTYREIEYHVDTGELFFHGEQYHGLDYYGGSDDFWWCTLNSVSHGSGLLDFLMDHNDNAAAMKAIALANGWTTYSSDNYSFLTMEPLPSQKTYINHTAPVSPGQTNTTEAYTTDYEKIANDQLLYVLYRETMKIEEGDLILFGAGDWETVCEVLGRIRLECSQYLELTKDNEDLEFLWVTEFQ